MPVTYVLEGHTAVITLDRPEALNAIDLEMWDGFGAATAKFAADAEAWVGIVTGAGPRAFCAGADVKTSLRAMMDDPRSGKFKHPATIMRGQVVEKPLIAAVNGLALGGGLEIALACDIRIAARTARFGAPEVGLGAIPGWGATQRLPRHVLWAVATKMILSGEMISADEALACGLVSKLVEPDELMDEARKVAAQLCTRAPAALVAAKKAMVAALNLPLEEGLATELELFNGLAYTEDVREGIEAFEQKRPPVFKGK
jgi:enoyl-CoA hydratase/carnithine racemase